MPSSLPSSKPFSAPIRPYSGIGALFFIGHQGTEIHENTKKRKRYGLPGQIPLVPFIEVVLLPLKRTAL